MPSRASLAVLVLGVLAGLGAAASAPASRAAPPGEPRVRLSLLALGDTGEPRSRLFPALDTQLRVGRALAAEDRRAPVDVLLLLGDLFYPNGLEADVAEARIRANLVEPYCRFVDLGAPLGARVAGPCADGSRPLPIHAVMGNHDHHASQGVTLYAEDIPRYLANWHMAAGPVDVVELDPGVSLILYDPRRLEEDGDFEPLRSAIEAARGPWRILVSHYPLDETPRAAIVRETLARVAVPFQLHLAGHEHNLRAGVIEAPRPLLQIVSGGGAEAREARREVEGERFALLRPGFVRIDLVDRPDGPRLVVSFVSTAIRALEFWEPVRLASRWSVGLAGDVREEPTPMPDPLHPAVVHFPIALVTLMPFLAAFAAIAIAMGRLEARSWLLIVGLQALLAGSAWFAEETGHDQEERVEKVVEESFIHEHEEAAERLVWVAAASFVVSAAGLLRGRNGARARVAAVAVALVAAGFGYPVGRSGGALVYEHGAASAYTGSQPAP